MNIEREYEIVLQPVPEGGFSVFMPELPSVATQGKMIEETREMAKERLGDLVVVDNKNRSKSAWFTGGQQVDENPSGVQA
jgi:predicted RNase H-like HicB family nuclease